MIGSTCWHWMGGILGAVLGAGGILGVIGGISKLSNLSNLSNLIDDDDDELKILELKLPMGLLFSTLKIEVREDDLDKGIEFNPGSDLILFAQCSNMESVVSWTSYDNGFNWS